MNDHGTIRETVEGQALSYQHGAVNRHDALAAGMTANQIDRRVRRGQWQPLGPQGWYVLAERAGSPLAALSAATVALRGPAWADSALALFGRKPHPSIPVVASPKRYTGTGARRIQVARLQSLPRTNVEGIDTVTAAVAVVAAGRWLRSDTDLHLLIEAAVRDGVVEWRDVERILRLFPRRGRAGSTRMRQVLESHRSDPTVPLSEWSRLFVVGITNAGLPTPRMEHRIHDGSGRLLAQVDIAYPNHRYAIELDSHAFHLNSEAFERDRRRDGTLAQVGWLVRRFTWRQWQQGRPWVVATIRADLAGRGDISKLPRGLAG